MSEFPRDRSYAQAAVDAVIRSGHRPVDMAYFAAREGKPEAYCEHQVRSCDVYVGVIGFRYGSLVPDRADQISYTDVEFRAATAAALPRLLFLLDEDAPVPTRLVDRNRDSVEEFRDRLRAAGVIVQGFATDGALEAAVLHALSELRGAQGALPVRNRLGVRRPDMVPPVMGGVVERPGLAEELAANLTADTSLAGTITGLEGVGGFGKTTLAASVCRLREVEERFPGGILWVTIGENTAGAELAGAVNGLCEVLSGERGTSSDPKVAGTRFAELLEARESMLVVVDDVWKPAQLEPFLVGGPECRRLVISRNKGVVPPGPKPLLVDTMTRQEAAAVVTAEINGVSPADVALLVKLTGRWPVLLDLAGRALGEHVRDGASPAEAVGWLIDRLKRGGPAALDPNDAGSRNRAVAATVDASLDLLNTAERDRYLEMAVLAPDVDVPIDVLGLLWGATGSMGDAEVAQLRDKIVRLRLASGPWLSGRPAVRLHDVLRSYLRHLATSTRCAAVNTTLIHAARRLLRESGENEYSPWWTLPANADYLWRHVPYHLAEARRTEELTQLVCDLRWVEAKTARFGSSVLAEADLALVDTETGWLLRKALGPAAHLLTRIDPPAALGATLASRLGGVPGLGETVDRYRRHLQRPRLENRWPVPDQVLSDQVLPGQAQPDSGGIVHDFAGIQSRHGSSGGHTGGVYDCDFSPDGRLLASAGEDGTVRIWEVSTGRLRSNLGGHTGGVRSCAFSPDGRLVAFGRGDSSLEVREVATSRLVALLAGHTGWVYDCAFSPDGRQLASASADRTVRIWDVASGSSGRKPAAVLEGHTGGVYGCAFSPDGRQLASASADRTMRIWDVADGIPDGTPNAVLEGHTGGIWGCDFSPDGLLLASASADRTVRIWDAATGNPTAVLKGHSAGANDCAFSSDAQLLASAGNDGTVRIWDMSSRRTVTILEGHAGWVQCCALSPDGRLLASAGFDANVRIWDVATGEAVMTSEGRADGVWGCAFSPDGGFLASTGRDGKVYIREIATGQSNLVLEGHAAGANYCAFSSGGRLLASTGEDGVVRVWDAATGQPTAILNGHTGHTGGIWGCAFSPDGGLLAATNPDLTLRIWDVASGRSTAVLKGHTGGVWKCVFSPDGRLLASTSSDGTVRIWVVATGLCEAILEGHGDWVWGCAFSPDGRLLATASNDWTLRVWDTATGACTAAVRVARPLHDCAWQPHENTIAAAGGGGSYLFSYRM